MSMQSIKTKDKLIFYRLLATMTNAWMSLIQSIGVLESQEKNTLVKTILSSIFLELKTWKSLSECLSKFPISFWEAEIWIIKSWEKTGKLNTVLSDLALQIEKVSSMSWKLKSALIYPSFIIAVVFGVVFIMMTKVVPWLLSVFWYNPALWLNDPINIAAVAKLPTSTQTLVWISNIFTSYWYLMIIGLLLLIVWLKIWRKTINWRYLYDKYFLSVPVLWWITKKIILSKFSRTFSWLVSSWVSIVESLYIVSEAVWNEFYRQRIVLLAQDVKSGIKIYEAIEWDKLFPEMMIQMIKIWEETARLDYTILKISDFYDEQVDNTINAMNKILEPFIIVALAIIVWWIAVWIMEPIMNLSNTMTS